MNIIVCLDDDNGMLFNKRRQSSDRKVLEDITTLTTKLWLCSFSEQMLHEWNEQSQIELQIDDDFLNKAGQGEYCFVEDRILKPHISAIEQVVIYKWNRRYPSDIKLDIDLNEWKLSESIDFAGTSHEKITRERYVKIYSTK